ncbi:MAG: SMP-30/gluconolactonase/LRE family protein [Chloroflexi bacterium]|nr:SMP-30/gluconolactonase/LRE family protein [Chloroflexota bacterium]
MPVAEHYLQAANKLGEGPLWQAAERALYWVDIERHCFHRFFPNIQNQETFQVGQPIGCLAFCISGKLMLGLQDGIGFWDWETGSIEIIVNPEADRKGARFNDGRVDNTGRFWAGTLGEDDQSKLYRLDPDGSIHIMETGITISNGIGWSPNNQTMYYTDSPLRVIYAYDFDPESGRIENRKEFIRVPIREGFPDGLTVDSEGFVWSAQWDGWQITRYDPDGKIERVIPLPVQRPTSCTFGGPDLNQLFITSAWTGLNEIDRREQPLAGDLFCVQTDVIGQQENYFNG